MDAELKQILIWMKYELLSNKLEVILMPHPDPPNVGAQLRVSSSQNCEWYRDICSDFESKRKQQYKKFKTKIKRKNVICLLDKMINEEKTRSKYYEWIINRAKYELHILNSEMEKENGNY